MRCLKTVLVTGANGFIGRHVVRALSKFDVNVVGVDISSEGFTQDIPFYECDLFNGDVDLFSVIDCVPDVCLHLAWRNGFEHNSTSHIGDLSGHFLFLNRLVSGGVGQIAVMGTMHEIGYWEGAIDENTPCNPSSYYGIAKDALRRSFLLMAENFNIKAQWLRAFYIYGDDQKSQSIFGKLIRAAASGDKEFPFTTGKNQFDFIHVDDLSYQIAACVVQDDVLGIINCCSGRPESLAVRIEGFIRENDLEISLKYGAYPDRPYDSPAIWGDSSKIDEILSKCTIGR